MLDCKIMGGLEPPANGLPSKDSLDDLSPGRQQVPGRSCFLERAIDTSQNQYGYNICSANDSLVTTPASITVDEPQANQTQEVFQRVAQGDDDACRDVFERYLQRLVGLARSRLSERLAAKVDAEDVVQSVFRSFFIRAQDGQYVIERAGDLWKLLAAITRHKVLKRAEHFQQQRRSLDREAALAEPGNENATAEPNEADAVALADEVEFLMRQLEPHQREMLELRLQGKTIPEIADAVNRSERTVRRFLSGFRDSLQQRLSDLKTG